MSAPSASPSAAPSAGPSAAPSATNVDVINTRAKPLSAADAQKKLAAQNKAEEEAEALRPATHRTIKVTLDPTLPPEIALKKALDDERARVMDLFRDMDTNDDGVISKNEFIIGLLQMGLPGGDLAAELFDSWDVDKSGTIEYVELSKAIRRGAPKVEIAALKAAEAVSDAPTGLLYATRTEASHKASFKADLSDSNVPPEVALRQALNAAAARVMDLFRDMDTNGDGVISKKEFIIGLEQLGLPGRQASAQLFDSWDVDGSGTIEFDELNKVLRRGQEMAGSSALASGKGSMAMAPRVIHRPPYVVKITSRRNWSRKKVDGASDIVIHLPKVAKELKADHDALSKSKVLSPRDVGSPRLDPAAREVMWREAGVSRPGSARHPTSGGSPRTSAPPVSSPRLEKELRERMKLAAQMKRRIADEPRTSEQLWADLAKFTKGHQHHADEMRKVRLELARRRAAEEKEESMDWLNQEQLPTHVKVLSSPLAARMTPQSPRAAAQQAVSRSSMRLESSKRYVSDARALLGSADVQERIAAAANKAWTAAAGDSAEAKEAWEADGNAIVKSVVSAVSDVVSAESDQPSTREFTEVEAVPELQAQLRAMQESSHSYAVDPEGGKTVLVALGHNSPSPTPSTASPSMRVVS